MTKTEIKRALVVGLTGSIGSGKSVVAEMFRQHGAVIIDADLLAREVVEVGSSGLQEVVGFFGKDVLTGDGALDRGKLGEKIFADPEAKRNLEAIVHPRIRELLKKRLEEIIRKDGTDRLIIYVAPLLFDVKSLPEGISKTIVVSSDRSLCIERVVKRDNLSYEQAAKRYDSQLSNVEREARASIIICNNGTLEELQRAVDDVYSKLKKDFSS